MAKFELENSVEAKFSVNKTTSAYLVDSDWPEAVVGTNELSLVSFYKEKPPIEEGFNSC